MSKTLVCRLGRESEMRGSHAIEFVTPVKVVPAETLKGIGEEETRYYRVLVDGELAAVLSEGFAQQGQYCGDNITPADGWEVRFRSESDVLADLLGTPTTQGEVTESTS